MTSVDTPSPRRRLATVALLCLLLAVALALATGSEGHAADAKPSAAGAKPSPAAKQGGKKQGGRKNGGKGKKKYQQPNIVMVMTDDQAPSTVLPEVMPNLFSKFMPRGTTYSDYIVTTPLCCPARAAYLTGEYGHNNGVLRNFYPDLKQKRSVLPTWLQRAGYNTAHVGKFLNSYESGKLGPAAPAPGYDLWFTELEKRRYYNWKASLNGKIRHYGNKDKDHATTVTTNYATRWTKRLAAKKAPFYMQVDYYAPHTSTGRDNRCASGPVPEPQDEGRFDGYPLPQPPNYNEADVSRKPADIQDRPPISSDDQAGIERRFRCGLEAIYGIDRGLKRIYEAVKKKKELKNTVFIFTSDNGYFYGEHRIVKGKPDPYEENLNVPLTVVVPPKYRNRAPVVPGSDAPVANIDLAPTILDLAHAKPCLSRNRCRVMDGRSMMPIMDGTGGFPDPRGIGIELYDCEYRGARYDGKILIEHSKLFDYGCGRTDTELYDLRQDPYELNNLYPAPDGSADAGTIAEYERMTATLGDCAGIKGRDPAPKSGHYCP